MKKYIFKTPEGFSDVLHRGCAKRVEVENSIRNIFKGHGCMEVDTPTLEYYDLFTGKTDTISQERMFKLFDLKGRILVLRPDITVPIMRMAVTKLGNTEYPIRLSYFGNVFRNDIKNLIDCEYRQAGIEVLGSKSIMADAEIISIAIKSLLAVGLHDFRIDIGQVKLFKALTSAIEDEEVVENIRESVANKDQVGIEKLLEDIELEQNKKQCILKLPWMFGSIEVIDDLGDLISKGEERGAIEELKELLEILKSWGYEKYISVDLGMVQSLNYYSGIVFRGYAVECGFSICWGGRYDYLSQNFNKSIFAAGCALGINRIIEVLERTGSPGSMKSPDFFITTENNSLIGDAFRVSEALRQKGYIVENDLIYQYNKALEYCRKKGIHKIIKVFDDDTAVIKDLILGVELEYSLNSLLEGRI